MERYQDGFRLARLHSGLGLPVTGEAGNDEAITKEDVAKTFTPEFSPYAGRTYPTRCVVR